jgi:uncharacterized protein YkwD
MNSPGHRDQILNPNFEDIGVGFTDKKSTAWCVVLGTKNKVHFKDKK